MIQIMFSYSFTKLFNFLKENDVTIRKLTNKLNCGKDKLKEF